jgi:SulP family sulfate permease
LAEVLSAYATTLNRAGGRLYLSGVSDQAYELLNGSGKLHLSAPVNVFEATSIVGESTEKAHAEGTAWLVEQGVAAASVQS